MYFQSVPLTTSGVTAAPVAVAVTVNRKSLFQTHIINVLIINYIMFFEDIFYPGNPERREKVRMLKLDIVKLFRDYQSQWNETMSYLNNALQEADHPMFRFSFLLLLKDIDNDNAKECLDEIKMAAEDAKTKMNKIVKDLGLDKYLPKGDDINPDIVNFDPDAIKYIAANLVTAGIGGFTAGFTFSLLWYSLNDYLMLSPLFAACGAVLVYPISLILSAMGAGLAFAISDMIVSAINGAIVRHELEDAIKELTKAKDNLKPLSTITSKLYNLKQCIENEQYFLDKNHLLRRNEKGEWRIKDLSGLCMATGSKASNERILKKMGDDEGILVFAA